MSIFFQKSGISPEKLKILGAPTTIDLNIFGSNFARVSHLAISTKEYSEFFFIFVGC